MRFLYFTIVSTWCIIIIEDKLSYLMEVVVMIKITVSTWKQAIELAHKMSDTHAVKIVANIYKSDEDFKGVIIHVK